MVDHSWHVALASFSPSSIISLITAVMSGRSFCTNVRTLLSLHAPSSALFSARLSVVIVVRVASWLLWSSSMRPIIARLSLACLDMALLNSARLANGTEPVNPGLNPLVLIRCLTTATQSYAGLLCSGSFLGMWAVADSCSRVVSTTSSLRNISWSLWSMPAIRCLLFVFAV